jgi:hypothetical protein
MRKRSETDAHHTSLTSRMRKRSLSELFPDLKHEKKSTARGSCYGGDICSDIHGRYNGSYEGSNGCSVKGVKEVVQASADLVQSLSGLMDIHELQSLPLLPTCLHRTSECENGLLHVDSSSEFGLVPTPSYANVHLVCKRCSDRHTNTSGVDVYCITNDNDTVVDVVVLFRESSTMPGGVCGALVEGTVDACLHAIGMDLFPTTVCIGSGLGSAISPPPPLPSPSTETQLPSPSTPLPPPSTATRPAASTDTAGVTARAVSDVHVQCSRRAARAVRSIS